MEAVLYIWLVIIYLWLVCPSKTKETVGNQPKKGFKYIEIPIVKLEYNEPCTIKFALLDDGGNLVETSPEFQVEQVKAATKVAKRTVASMRLQVRDLGIKGSARMNKAQLEQILSQH
jgi:hypothetical protein